MVYLRSDGAEGERRGGGGEVMPWLTHWRFLVLLCLFAGGIHCCFVAQGLFHLLRPYPFNNASFVLVRGRPGQDLGLFCYMLQLLSVVGLNVGTPLRLATPVQVASCLFPFLAAVSCVDAALPIFKREAHIVYSVESDVLARLAVAVSLLFLSGISLWVDWALRASEGLPNWGSMGHRDPTLAPPELQRIEAVVGRLPLSSSSTQFRKGSTAKRPLRRGSSSSADSLDGLATGRTTSDLPSATRLHQERRRSRQARYSFA